MGSVHYLLDSPLLTLPRQARWLPHALLVIFLAVAMIVFSSLLAAPLLLLLLGRGAIADGPIAQGLRLDGMLMISFSGIFLSLWLWTRFAERRPFVTLGLPLAGAWQAYWRGWGWGVGLIALSAVLLFLANGFGVAALPTRERLWVTLLGVFLTVPGWMVQGAAEEVLIRGWVMPVIGARHHPWAGVLVSALLFAALHALNPGLSPLALLNLVLFGLFAAVYALREGSLWGICGLHAAWNWAEGNLFGFQVSGAWTEPSLWQLQPNGPDWLSGAAFGPEGSLVVTLVTLLAMLWLLRPPRPAPVDPQ